VVRQISDRIVVMRRGQIVEQGPGTDVISRPVQNYTRQLVAAAPRLSERGSLLQAGRQMFAANEEQG
jgi:peptide/nickel transport system ATP-binding protein